MVPDWQHQHHPSHSDGLDALDAHCGSGLDLSPCKVTGDVLAETPRRGEPPSPVVAGQSFGCLPVIRLGKNEGARPLLPRERTGLAGWLLWRGRAAPEGASHADSTGHHRGSAWAECVGLQRAEKLLCYRVVEEWVLGEKNFSVLPAFLPREPHFCVYLHWRIWILLLCEWGPKAVFFLRALVEVLCRN